MKTFVLILCSLIGVVSCQNQEQQMNKVASDTTNYTTIKWIDSVKNIGLVEAGAKTEIKFRFKNTGSKPLFIIAARPGCGCTIADYPKEAIAPGAEGVITANYNVNKGSQGEFRKNISVSANTKGTTNHNIFFYGKIKNSDSTNKVQ